MVVSAVLPPRTAWGFEFRSPATATGDQVQPSFGANTSLQSTASPLHGKRKIEDSEDEIEHTPVRSRSNEMDSFSNSFQQHHQQLSTASAPRYRTVVTPPSISKRPRLHPVSGKHLPVGRVLESLDRKGLQNLIEQICQSHPYLVSELTNLAPKVTVSTSIENLKTHLHAVYNALPYKGDQRGDYAYLRVRPYIEEFLSALTDYTSNFLPPHEGQPSNSLEFLDSATHLLNQLPVWTNPLNNHSRNVAYEDINTAWIVAIKEAVKRNNGLGLAHGGWEDKINKHNQNCGDKLLGAVNCILQELSWMR